MSKQPPAPDPRQEFERLMALERKIIGQFKRCGDLSLLHKLSRIQQCRAEFGRQLKIGLLKE